MPFSERDWQHLRDVHPLALERFCTRVLTDAVATAHEDGRSAHERYLALFRLLQGRDAAMAAAFDDLRRSPGLQRLSAMVALDLVTHEELAGLSPDVQNAARELGQALASPRPAMRRRPP